ncbi:helix-turn-helix transcriptional regulator [Ruficoccus amylovorans]|uniref:Helix-turn-helix transcriptional regulator n=1 Tax=Ruficoccus amylovorans TaxID=1804625 RepID=A0A842HF89_9BACT|nr:helix-turn-helix transcriptional regulator [Ruficoccus amylovorans]MBC2595193.1 helix-turn-helix transcriptional regulator [Ruficoccus amylovorans]
MTRKFWEFQVVLDGSIAQISTDHPSGHTSPASSRLWISPPGSKHGWTGIPGQPATIVVFHFHYISEELSARLIGRSHNTVIDLSNGEVQELQRLAIRVNRYWHQPSAETQLCFEHALLSLCLLSCEGLNRQEPPSGYHQAEKRVRIALTWYREHMHLAPALPEIAQAAHSSPANLRRLFHRVFRASPKQLFDQLRYQRSMQLLTETQLPLSEIAERCGFQDLSTFSRAFKQRFGYCPSETRSPPASSPGSRLSG